MAVQRRLAAILAADVAGYSRLMGEDEERMHAAQSTQACARSGLGLPFNHRAFPSVRF